MFRQGFAITLREKKPDFFASGRDSVSILVASACSWALLAALRGVPGALRERPDNPKVAQSRPGTPRRAARNVRECAEATKTDAESRPEARKSGLFSRNVIAKP